MKLRSGSTSTSGFTMDEKAINQIISKVSESVTSKVIDAVSSIILGKIEDKFRIIEEKISKFESIAMNNKKDILIIDERVDALEQYSKRCNLRLFGIKINDESDVKAIVVDFFSLKMGLSQLRSSDIEICYKTANFIFVKFRSFEFKHLVCGLKSKLKGTGVIVKEDLTNFRYNALRAAEKKYGNKNVWTLGGKIRWKVDDSIVKPTFGDLKQLIQK